MKRMTMKEYVDSRFKRIQDSINNYANGKDIDQIELLDNNISIEEKKINKLLAVGDAKDKVKPDDILLDTNHRFMTDIEKEKIRENITRTELEAAENDIVNNLKLTMNQQIDNIINDKGAIDAINKIKKVISENQDTIDLFKNLVDKDELDTHSKYGSHITYEDRIALNMLLKFIDKGCADWNAEEGEANYIRNKPISLPANGGNADTVGHYKPEYLFNKQLAKRIIGINNAKSYTSKDVNVLLNKDTINKLSDYLCANSLTYIREGYYKTDDFKMPVNSNISGVGVATQIDNCKAVNINNNSKLHDIYFTNSNIFIHCNESEIVDTVFKNCTISFECSRVIIKKCRFIDCTICNQRISNCIINDNICSGKTNKIEYYGGNNIISNLYI